MGFDEDPSSTWSSRLHAARARVFVGREAELRRSARFLSEPSTRLLHVHGPPGMGKSTLGREIAARAQNDGRRVLVADAREVRGSLDALARAVGPSRAGCDLLIVDSLEALGALESWLRETFLPGLPEDVRVMTLGQRPLSPAWTADAGWQALAAELELGPLTAPEGLAYLERRGIDEPAARRRIVEAASGWPLALGLLADRATASPQLTTAHIEHALAHLSTALVEEAPSREHATALYAAAVVQALTEPLLAAMLGRSDARELFRWIEGRAGATSAGTGLRLHATLVDALYEHLRLNAPETLETLRRRAHAWYAGQLRDAKEHGSTDHRVIFGDLIYDALYTVRERPIVRSFGVGIAVGCYPAVPTPEEVEAIVAAVERHEGRGAGGVCRRWLRRSSSEALVYRDADHVAHSFAVFAPLSARDASDVAFDPVVTDLFAALDERDPLRECERMMLCRYWLSIEHGQGQSSELGQLISVVSQRLAFSPRIAMGAAVHVDPDAWTERPDLTHTLVSRSRPHGVELGVFIHDWRREPADEWFHRFVRALAGDPTTTAARPETEGVRLLDRAAFGRAVRDAVKQLRQPERLCESPLARAPLVVRSGPAPGSLEAAETLRRILERAIDALGDDHDTILRATFVEPSPKQLAVADGLGMAFSTYRRHLKRATDRLTERLWAWETRSVPG